MVGQIAGAKVSKRGPNEIVTSLPADLKRRGFKMLPMLTLLTASGIRETGKNSKTEKVRIIRINNQHYN